MENGSFPPASTRGAKPTDEEQKRAHAGKLRRQNILSTK
jgi:hypothetical protein